jgi:hypothetical protein
MPSDEEVKLARDPRPVTIQLTTSSGLLPAVECDMASLPKTLRGLADTWEEAQNIEGTLDSDD